MTVPNYAFPPGGGLYYATPPYGEPAYPPEAQSLNEVLTAAKIIALIVAVFELLGFLTAVVIWLLGLPFGWFGAFLLVGSVVNLLLFIEVGRIQARVVAGQYEEAKSQMVLWVILGFVFGWIVVGALVLAAYVKFDRLLLRPRGWGAPGWPGYPAATGQPAYRPVPVFASPLPAGPVARPPPSNAAGAPPTFGSAPGAVVPPMVLCPHCGRPPTWVIGFNRWYCYVDGLYL